MDQELYGIRNEIVRTVLEHNARPLDVGAACASMALRQSLELGTRLERGELDQKQVPTKAPVQVMEKLSESPDVKRLFVQIAQPMLGAINVTGEVYPYKPMRGHFYQNVGIVEDEKLRSIAERVGAEFFPALDQDTADKASQAAVWFWLFQTYQNAADRLGVEEIQLDQFDDVPENIANCIRQVLDTVNAKKETNE